jgi:hypothetical protein
MFTNNNRVQANRIFLFLSIIWMGIWFVGFVPFFGDWIDKNSFNQVFTAFCVSIFLGVAPLGVVLGMIGFKHDEKKYICSKCGKPMETDFSDPEWPIWFCYECDYPHEDYKESSIHGWQNDFIYGDVENEVKLFEDDYKALKESDEKLETKPYFADVEGDQVVYKDYHTKEIIPYWMRKIE